MRIAFIFIILLASFSFANKPKVDQTHQKKKPIDQGGDPVPDLSGPDISNEALEDSNSLSVDNRANQAANFAVSSMHLERLVGYPNITPRDSALFIEMMQHGSLSINEAEGVTANNVKGANDELKRYYKFEVQSANLNADKPYIVMKSTDPNNKSSYRVYVNYHPKSGGWSKVSVDEVTQEANP